MSKNRQIKWRTLITLIGAVTLVGTELVGVTWAAGWALGGLLQMSQTFSLIAEANRIRLEGIVAHSTISRYNRRD